MGASSSSEAAAIVEEAKAAEAVKTPEQIAAEEAAAKAKAEREAEQKAELEDMADLDLATVRRNSFAALEEKDRLKEELADMQALAGGGSLTPEAVEDKSPYWAAWVQVV